MNMVTDPRVKAALVKERATRAGFDLVRITTAEEFVFDREAALQRIGQGLMDGLPWYHQARVNRGSSPRELLPGARSIICLGLNYFTDDEGQIDSDTEDNCFNEGGPPLVGKIARYARGRDYHRVMKRKMRALVDDLSQQLDSEISARWYVDDGPMLDRAAAARSGLGWFGKNTNILTSELGSWIFLGQIITDLELEPDASVKKTCGNCVSCMDACPTGAIVAPYVIDNARCISYQTIENRGAIPREIRPLMLDWVFGCDICQEVCPVNRKGVPAREPQFGRRGLAIADLTGLLQMTEEQFRARFSGTPIMRARYSGMQRNACVALGNLKNPEAVPALAGALDSPSPLVRSHAAWALGETGTREAVAALQEALEIEQDAEALEEIAEALAKCHA